MPKKAPLMTEQIADELKVLGAHVGARRKTLRVSATVAAEAAGVSRVTLHRVEKGEPSVTMGAWCSVIGALGMHLQLQEDETASQTEADFSGWWPVRIGLADYPQLKALAWQVQGTGHLTPVEALDIYERHARHLDLPAMTAKERELWQALHEAFGKRLPHV